MNVFLEFKARALCRGASLSLLLMFLFGFLQAQSLFTVKDGERLSDQQRHYLRTFLDEPTTSDYRIIEVDFSVLEKEHLWLELKGERYHFTHTRTTYRDHDDYSWSGDLNGEFGRCNLVVKKDRLTGIFRMKGELYQIYPLGEGRHVFLFKNPSRFPDDCSREYAPEDQREVMPSGDQEGSDYYEEGYGLIPEAGFQPLAAGPCKLRLLVAYTDDVDAAYADIMGHVQAAVDDHNDANDNSQVNHDVELARSMEVAYNESADDLGVFLDDFETDGDGKMDDVHDDRSLFDADVCVLMTLADGDACGLASGIGSSYGTAFCVSVAGCSVGNHTFAHEVGHLHGCRHDTYVDTKTTPFAYGHGYVYFDDLWRTVMAYNNECDCDDEVSPCPAFDDRSTPGSPYCDRLQYWSTPDVTYGGVPMGTVSTEKNERVLDETAADLAGYENYEINKVVFDSRNITNGEEFDIQGETSLTTDVNDPFTIFSGAKGNFRAGTEITLKEGFHARSGSEFRAWLDNCTNLSLTGNEDPVTRKEPPQIRVEEADNLVVQLTTFPNPFTDKLHVRYRVTQDTEVSMRLVDMLGRQVAFILEQDPTPAELLQMTTFDGSRLAAGTYTLIVRAGDQRHTKRVVKVLR